jgi:UDP-2,3-diacylglucosamine hydrolase
MENTKKTYFISDAHFGLFPPEESKKREKLFVNWLSEVSRDAEEIYILGDLFEFWFEYKSVIPKGYARLFGKLAELTDRGIPIYFFRGNHDIWAFDYLEQELGIQIINQPQIKTIQGTIFYIGHGDGLGQGDNSYKLLKKIFTCKINQFLFRWLHPDLGSVLGHFFSGRSKKKHHRSGIEYVNERGLKRLSQYCENLLITYPQIKYFIFGHVHKPATIKVSDTAYYISLGDWIKHFTYAVFDGKEMKTQVYR